MTKHIGLLTSGGDCAGLNAAIRAVVLAANDTYGFEVIGIRNGTEGLLARPIKAETLDPTLFDGAMLRQAGTLLGTVNRGDPTAYPMANGEIRDRTDEFVESYKTLGLDGLIVIGGDGSLTILRRLAQAGGLNLIAIPKTIDNDVAGTDRSIGFHTALTVATEALDRLQPTAASHGRVMVLEVMGRNAGHIALEAGIAGGADVILVPELSYSIDGVAAKIERLRVSGRNFALVVAAEGLHTTAGGAVETEAGRFGGIGHYLAHQIEQVTDMDARVTVLGYTQRGAEPGHHDRVIATAMGVRAVDLFAAGQFDRMAAWIRGAVDDVPLDEVVGRSVGIDPDGALVRSARALGIYMGEAG